MKRAALTAFLLGSLVAAALAQKAGDPATIPDAAVPAKVGSAELIENAKTWDGRLVLFEGEAIGDSMKRGDHVWVNVLDSNAAMGIWMTEAQAAIVGRYGSYRMTGDSLRITGIFHRACPDHGGDMDIHASGVEMLAEGKDRTHPLRPAYLWLLLPVFAVAGALFALWRRREKALGLRKG